MDTIAVLVAAAAGFGFGAAWYSLLAKRWRAAVGLPEAEIEAHMKTPAPYAAALAGAVVTAGFLRHLMAMSGVEGAGAGLIAGLGLGAFAAAPWLATSYAFARRPLALTLIDMGHVTGACGAIGLVLGLFA